MELTKPRACSLVAKCFVEVLVIEKEVFVIIQVGNGVVPLV